MYNKYKIIGNIISTAKQPTATGITMSVDFIILIADDDDSVDEIFFKKLL